MDFGGWAVLIDSDRMIVLIKEILKPAAKYERGENLMPLLYAKPTEHAIRALILLATQENPKPMTVQEIAETEDISSHHLAKVMKVLAQNKVIKSSRGPGGGYILLKEADKITVWDLMGYFEDQSGFKECALGWTDCQDNDPCPFHDRWGTLRESNQRFLQNVTIEGLAIAALNKKPIYQDTFRDVTKILRKDLGGSPFST